MKTIPEPTAAALRYSLTIKKKITEIEKKDSIVMTFDLGAGTLDITLLQLIRDGDDLIPCELPMSGNEAWGDRQERSFVGQLVAGIPRS